MVLPEAFYRFRNRLLSDPRFVAFAQKFPLTRPIARYKARKLFDLLAGFSYSQVLFACVETGLIMRVGVNGVLPSTLAQDMQWPIDRLRILVDAAVALDLLQWQGNHIIWGPQGAALVAQPWIMGFVKHHAHFYRDLTDPVTLIKGDAKGQAMKGYWSYQDEGSDKLGYSQLMAQSQAAVSVQVLGAYDFKKHYRVLDVGGGTGAFLSAIGAAHPQLDLNLFDLPGVVALVDDPKIARHAGDFRLDALPRAMDLVTLVRVVHDHDDDVVLQLLRNIRKSCSVNTTLLIAEPMAGTKATSAVTDAYFNLYFAAMGQGRTRTPEAISALAGQAGFAGMKTWETDMPLIANVITFRQIGNEL